MLVPNPRPIVLVPLVTQWFEEVISRVDSYVIDLAFSNPSLGISVNAYIGLEVVFSGRTSLPLPFLYLSLALTISLLTLPLIFTLPSSS